jgi:hypothetical protein
MVLRTPGSILAGKYRWQSLNATLTMNSIDKSSSAELSEAINSMYMWYQKATICYAYLSDIFSAALVRNPDWSGIFDVKRRFKHSRWFTRGWTLQELLAPAVLEFYSADWQPFGTKEQLKAEISEITGINPLALSGDPLSNFNVAEKMSWAAERQTTRLEDKAYCLLGIFEVNMPLLYGEGSRAFLRLQEHVMQVIEDYSIMAWPGRNYDDNQGAMLHYQGDDATANNVSSILAADPAEFKRLDNAKWTYSDLRRADQENMKSAFQQADIHTTGGDPEPPAVTARGIRLSLPLLHLAHRKYLGCLYYLAGSSKQWLCIPLIQNEHEPQKFSRDARDQQSICFVNDSNLAKFKRRQIYGERIHPSRSIPQPASDLHLNSFVSKARQAYETFDEDEARYLYSRAITFSSRIHGYRSIRTMELIFSFITAAISESWFPRAQELALELAKLNRERLSNKESFSELVCHATILFPTHLSGFADKLFADIVDACETYLGEDSDVVFQVRTSAAAHFLRLRAHDTDKHYALIVLRQFRKRLGDEAPLVGLSYDCLSWFDEASSNWAGTENLLGELVYISRTVRGDKAILTIVIMLLQLHVFKHNPTAKNLHAGQIALDQLPWNHSRLDKTWRDILKMVYDHLTIDFAEALMKLRSF